MKKIVSVILSIVALILLYRGVNAMYIDAINQGDSLSQAKYSLGGFTLALMIGVTIWFFNLKRMSKTFMFSYWISSHFAIAVAWWGAFHPVNTVMPGRWLMLCFFIGSCVVITYITIKIFFPKKKQRKLPLFS